MLFLILQLAVGNFKDDGVHSRKTVLDVKFYMERQGSCSDCKLSMFYIIINIIMLVFLQLSKKSPNIRNILTSNVKL